MRREPAFVDGLRRSIPRAKLDTRGWAEGWAAAVGVFAAPDGFGEEVWHVPQSEVVLAWHLGGADVVSELPGFSGRSAQAGDQTFNLQTLGAPQRYRASAGVRFCHFYLGEGLIARVAEGLGRADVTARSLRDDLIMIEDRDLRQLLESYRSRAHDRSRPPSRIELEARAILVVEHLITRHHTAARPPPESGGLAPWQLKRACEAMAAHLDADLGLDDLARIAGCSPTHFSRAFKRSMGLAPFHWLAEQRVAKARELLEDNRLSLAEIALAVGFAAQPQFTTAFGRATGMTPGRWRRQRYC